MELQFEKKELSCLATVIRAVKDQEVTQEIRLTESMPDVGRVLAGWGQVILRGKEWQGSRLSASGGVQASVLYAPEDGSAPRMMDAWIPFQFKWDGAQTEREGPMRVVPVLRFVDGRNLSARKILIRAGISCLVEGLCEHRAEIFSPGDIPEDVQLLRRSYPVRLPREMGEKTFSLEQDLDLGTDSVDEIISCFLQPSLSEAKVSGDKVVMRGTGCIHLLYRTREETLRSKDFEIPFSQLGELERAYDADAAADVILAVTGLEIEMAEEKPALKCSVVAQYLVSDRTLLELVEDAYSPRREIGLREDELHLPMILDEVRERITVQGHMHDGAVDAADAVFWHGFPQVTRDGDRTEVIIPGRFQLLGCDRDGNLRAATAHWEGQASLNADGSSRVDAMALPSTAVSCSAAANGMELRTEMQLCMTTQSRRGMPMITGLELGPIRETDTHRPSLVLCRPGGRGLWNIAKGTGSSVSAIREANGLQDDPDDNRMLLIPIS